MQLEIVEQSDDIQTQIENITKQIIELRTLRTNLQFEQYIDKITATSREIRLLKKVGEKSYPSMLYWQADKLQKICLEFCDLIHAKEIIKQGSETKND